MGGVVGLGLLVAGVVWFVIRRRKAGAFGRPNYSAAPTTDDGHSAAGRYTDEAGVMGTTHSPSTEGGIPMKYYVRFSVLHRNCLLIPMSADGWCGTGSLRPNHVPDYLERHIPTSVCTCTVHIHHEHDGTTSWQTV